MFSHGPGFNFCLLFFFVLDGSGKDVGYENVSIFSVYVNRSTVRPAGWFDFSVVLHGFFIFSPYEKRKTRMNFA